MRDSSLAFLYNSWLANEGFFSMYYLWVHPQ